MNVSVGANSDSRAWSAIWPAKGSAREWFAPAWIGQAWRWTERTATACDWRRGWDLGRCLRRRILLVGGLGWSGRRGNWGGGRGYRGALGGTCGTGEGRKDGEPGGQLRAASLRCFLAVFVSASEFGTGYRNASGRHRAADSGELLGGDGPVHVGARAGGYIGRRSELWKQHVESGGSLHGDAWWAQMRQVVYRRLLRWLSGFVPDHPAGDSGLQFAHRWNGPGMRRSGLKLRSERAERILADLYASGSNVGGWHRQRTDKSSGGRGNDCGNQFGPVDSGRWYSALGPACWWGCGLLRTAAASMKGRSSGNAVEILCT